MAARLVSKVKKISGFISLRMGAERGFCKKCGSHLFYRLKQNNQHYIPVGIFDNSQDFVFDHQIFIDEKPEYYSFANETKNMTGEEVLLMFASSTEN